MHNIIMSLPWHGAAVVPCSSSLMLQLFTNCHCTSVICCVVIIIAVPSSSFIYSSSLPLLIQRICWWDSLLPLSTSMRRRACRGRCRFGHWQNQQQFANFHSVGCCVCRRKDVCRCLTRSKKFSLLDVCFQLLKHCNIFLRFGASIKRMWCTILSRSRKL